jgi:Putative polyhydroxyalkanoic acid system protein (PHA_gran_rgn)
VRIEVSHALQTAAAKARMQELGDYWQSKYGVRTTWTRDNASLAGTVMGVSFYATIEVGRDVVALEAPEPNFLIRKGVVEYLEHKMTDYLDQKNSLSHLRSRRGERLG